MRYPLVVVVPAIGLVAGALGVSYAINRGQDQEVCGGRVSIAADPRIAPAITDAVDAMPASSCVSVGVQEVAASDVSRSISRPAGSGIGGSLPDIWIADSSIWTDRAAQSSEGQDRLVGKPVSVASTPVVVAVSKSVADDMGWPDKQQTWRSLRSTPEGDVQLGLTSLDHDAAALATAAASGATEGDALADLATSVALPRSVKISSIDLINENKAKAVPSTEQEVFAAKDDKIVASYDKSLGSLDFPLEVVAALGKEPNRSVTRVRDELVESLAGKEGQRILSSHGLRSSDGAAHAPLAESATVDAAASIGKVAHDSGTLRAASKAWSGLTRRSRLVVAMDLSGSMGEQLPGSSQTRDQAAQAGFRALISSSPPDNEVSLWGFASKIGNGNYKVFTPLGPLAGSVGGKTRRETLLGRVSSLDAVPGGSTPLYDTVNAAYRAATRDYQFGKFNAVVVLTDGRNEDRGSITLAKLVDSLQKRFDGAKPVRIVTIAYGSDADTKTLRRIADATGGRSFKALNEKEIGAAIAKLATAE